MRAERENGMTQMAMRPAELPTAPDAPNIPRMSLFSFGSGKVCTRIDIAEGTVIAAQRPHTARNTRNIMGSTLTAHKMEKTPTKKRPMQKTGFG
ncbi:hypothetical protein EIP86_009994 [Pleurotus ostreatoroseus]|nr:hypothetical protein EIP86_009994 [Pleurotus ostreatoroseus]